MLLMAPFEACHSPQLNIMCDLSGSTCSSAKAQFPLARTVITSADKNVCFQFKPTQFHLAPALTLLGSRNSAGAVAGEEWEGRAVQGHPKAMRPRWLWPLSPVPAALALLCVCSAQAVRARGSLRLETCQMLLELLSAPQNKQLSISHTSGTQVTAGTQVRAVPVLPLSNCTVVRQIREVQVFREDLRSVST